MRSLKYPKSFFLMILFLCSCTAFYKPGSSLKDVHFKIYPHIVKKDNQYYLKYQISVDLYDVPPLLRIVYSRKKDNKGYYYFSVPISQEEKGALVERSLNEDGFNEMASNDAVYWLNRDNTETKLKIVHM